MQRVCQVSKCGRPYSARGFCRMHYSRWQRTGDARPEIPPFLPGTRSQQFDQYIEKSSEENGCWIWTGAIYGPPRKDPNGGGYGQFHWRDLGGGGTLAHRYSYLRDVGEIPVGMHLDHLCSVRACVRPSHMEAVTPEENNRRGNSITARNMRKTHCIAGHPFDGENLRILSGGGRACRECQRSQQRARRAGKREVVA